MNELENKTNQNIVAGFWLQGLSIFIDILILFVPLVLIGIFLRNFLEKFGEDFSWVYWVLFFLYMSFLESSIGKGQTLGKRILKIEVLSLDGSFLSLGKSFLRQSFFLVLLILPSGYFLRLNVPVEKSLYLFFSYQIIFAFAYLTMFLLLILHPQKRGLADIVCGSIVVKKEKFDEGLINQLNNPFKIKRAYGIIIFCMILFSIGFWLSDKKQEQYLKFSYDTAQTINHETEFKNTMVQIKGISAKNQPTQIYLIINAFMMKNRTLNNDFVKQEIQKTQSILEKLFAKHQMIWGQHVHQINFEIRTGFKIGFFSYYERVNVE